MYRFRNSRMCKNYNDSWKCWLRFVIIFLMSFVSGALGAEAELALMERLFARYDPDVRPVKNFSHAVNVTFEFALQDVINLDLRDQILTTNLWLRVFWTDEQLVWNTTEYWPVHTINVSPDRIWKPDITLYNDVSKTRPSQARYHPSVTSSGAVSWYSPAIIKSSCEVDVTYFPWDEQRCALQWGSWTLNGAQLDLHSPGAAADTAVFHPNTEWELLGVPAVRLVDYYACCAEPFPSLTFTVILRRRPLFYIINLILPCAFITCLAGLVFLLPPESGEKVSLAVTVLLASTVYMLLVSETMPTQSKVIPLIGLYFLAVMLLLAISAVLTVIVLTTHHMGSSRTLPRWLHFTVLETLATVVGLRGHVTSCTASSKIQASSDDQVTIDAKESPFKEDVKNISDTVNKWPEEIRNEVKTVAGVLDLIKGQIKDRKEDEVKAMQWVLAAQVLDRFFLLLFLLLVVIVHLAILLNHP